MISNVNVLSENRSVAFLAISGALARGALGGPHTPGQVGVLYGPQTPGQNFQFISHHSSIIPEEITPRFRADFTGDTLFLFIFRCMYPELYCMPSTLFVHVSIFSLVY